ncbi:MAG: surface-adhesin E family protein [Pseudomonadota bacterium]
MNKTMLAVFLICSAASTVTTSEASAAGAGEGEWVIYAEPLNGDVYLYDTSRVEKIDRLRRVWSGIRYKTSVMGASSYLSLLEIDCSERTEKTLQSTFFTDKHWKKPAMGTDTSEKPKRQIVVGSATERLTEVLCD